MELKLHKGAIRTSHNKSSNRTFMELKLRQETQFPLRLGVLIAPLWN